MLEVYSQCSEYLTVILQDCAEYRLILSRQGRSPSWLNQAIFTLITKHNIKQKKLKNNSSFTWMTDIAGCVGDRYQGPFYHIWAMYQCV
jgi:hypothetical protein